jgi:hypothetical protein
MRGAVLAVWALAAVPACESGRGAAPTGPGDAASPGVTADAAPASAVVDARGTGDAGGSMTWSGSYKSEAASLYIPPELKVRWRPDETDAGIGEGRLTLSADGDGRVHGVVDGALGPAHVDGYFADGILGAQVTRQDPRDHGFSGVLTGKASGDRLEGTLNVSLAAGGALRAAAFLLTPGDGGAAP